MDIHSNELWRLGLGAAFAGLIGVTGNEILKKILRDRPMWVLVVWLLLLVVMWIVVASGVTPWWLLAPISGIVLLILGIVYLRMVEHERMHPPHGDHPAWEAINYILDETRVGEKLGWDEVVVLLESEICKGKAPLGVLNKRVLAWGWNKNDEVKRVTKQDLFDSDLIIEPSGGAWVGSDWGWILRDIRFCKRQVISRWRKRKTLPAQRPKDARIIRALRWIIIHVKENRIEFAGSNGETMLFRIQRRHGLYACLRDRIGVRYPDNLKDLTLDEVLGWIEGQVDELETICLGKVNSIAPPRTSAQSRVRAFRE